MKIIADLHTHTLASVHAYSSVSENAKAAFEQGLSVLGITDHAPCLPDGVHELHFMNYHVLPQEMFGVRMLYGSELNILDYEGAIDLNETLHKRMDICIASFHEFTLSPGSQKDNMGAYLGAMQNPYVDLIGHPDDGKIPVDFKVLAREAKNMDVMLEVNNSSLKAAHYRLNTRENMITMLGYCARYGTLVALGSDAHYHGAIGRFDEVLALIREIDFPEELIVNTSIEKIMKQLGKRHPHLVV